jgi:hypothetical protein
VKLLPLGRYTCESSSIGEVPGSVSVGVPTATSLISTLKT